MNTEKLLDYNLKRKIAQGQISPNNLNIDDPTEEPIQNRPVDENIPIIDENNINDFLADNFDEDEEQIVTPRDQIDIEVESPEVVVPDENIPEFGSNLEAMKWAEDNKRVVRINYITKKGIDLSRLVEVHGIFPANTGNTIVVTFDRTIGGIRAFIIDNIVNYAVLEQDFIPKFRVQSRKRIMAMKINSLLQLKTIGDELDSLKLYKGAAVVTGMMEDISNFKQAQYEGFQGHWIRNSRCFGNCYRQKRATKKDMPAQEVWMECQKEYEVALSGDTESWDKYAGEDKSIIKTANKNSQELFKKEQNVFNILLNKKVKNGMPFGNAVFASIEEGKNRYSDMLTEDATVLMSMAKKLKNNGHSELAQKCAEASAQIIKESQFWSNLKRDVGDAVRGKAKDMWGNIKEKVTPQNMGRYKQEGDVRREAALINNIINTLKQHQQETDDIINNWKISRNTIVRDLNQQIPILKQSKNPIANKISIEIQKIMPNMLKQNAVRNLIPVLEAIVNNTNQPAQTPNQETPVPNTNWENTSVSTGVPSGEYGNRSETIPGSSKTRQNIRNVASRNESTENKGIR